MPEFWAVQVRPFGEVRMVPPTATNCEPDQATPKRFADVFEVWAVHVLMGTPTVPWIALPDEVVVDCPGDVFHSHLPVTTLKTPRIPPPKRIKVSRIITE